MEESPISAVKQHLQQELDPGNFQIYLTLLREWFGQRLTKDLLEFEVRTLFGEKCLSLHNQLLETILRVSAGVPVSPAHTQSSKQHVPSGAVSTSQTTSAEDAVTSVNGHITSQEENSSIYIIPTAPGEEPFIYPPNAIDYPPQPEALGVVDVAEQELPPDCDWLQEVEITYPANEDTVSAADFRNRFPPWFAHDVQRVNHSNYAQNVNIVRNVTHLLNVMKDILERRPHLKQHFVIPKDKKVPYLTSGCSLYGRLLIKAWDYNIQNVNPLVTEVAVNAVREHIKNIVLGILKQRRPFRMRDNRIMHSVGVPYPNPYLRQGFHSYDEPYSSDTTKMADVVMQVPAPFPTIEEKERLAALQVASSYPSKDSRFISAKGTMMDFLLALKDNPSLIPSNKKRLKLMDTILRHTKSFTGSHNVQYPDQEDEDYLRSSPLLPLASY